jgi:anthranilate phosphoribosyltransferase
MIHAQLMAGSRLDQEQASHFMREVMRGDVSPVRLAAALAALRVRGETPEEIAGFARAMREVSVRLDLPSDLETLDTCGTGGDGAHTFNISTTAAFVAAAAGVKVAKHGNRAASSRSGSADVLEALGVDIDLGPDRVAAAIQSLGIGFLFARSFHPAMRYAAPIRADLATRTVFNLLGPLTNPAFPRTQLLGVFAPEWTMPVARVLQLLGARAALVVHGSGMDELTVCGPNLVAELRSSELRSSELSPEQFGVGTYDRSALVGGDASENAALLRAVLAGRGTPAQRDVVALNAGAAIYLAALTPDLPSGVALALEVLRSGKALELLEAYARFSRGPGS